MTTIATTIFTAGMLAAAAWDLRARRVPNALNLVLLAAGLGARAMVGGWSGLGLGVAGAALGLALLLLPFSARWIGGGDVKLVAAIGAWLGPHDVFWSTAIGLALGGLLSIVVTVAAGAAVRREVAANLKASLYAMSAPEAPRRPHAQLVPMALALGAAAVAVIFFHGGFHA